MELTRNLLVVDDKRTNRRLIREIFKDTHNVFEAENGAEALDILHSKVNIEVVILDIIMPVMDGFTFLVAKQGDSAIRAIPVIVISEANNDTNEERALDLGAADFITRPFNSRIVRRRVENIVTSRGQILAQHPAIIDNYANLIDLNIDGGILSRLAKQDLPIYFASKSLIQILGFKDFAQMNNAYGGSWLNAICAEDVLRVSRVMQKQCDDKSGFHIDYSLIKNDGSLLHVMEYGSLPRPRAAQPITYSFIIDISERVKREARAESFKDVFIAASEQSSELLIRYEFDNNSAYFSPHAAYELSLPTKLSDASRTFVESGVLDVSSMEEFIRLCIDARNGIPSGHGIIKLRSRKDGIRSYECFYTLLCDALSHPLHAVITLKHICS